MYKKFYEFGISDAVLKSLSDMGFEEPTPIQKIAIPPALKGRDVIGQAQTGTGKTVAFGVPLIEKAEKGKFPYAIALVPTRELAVQVASELNKIGQSKGVTCVAIYGGQSMEGQIRSLKRGVDIVVGTPGRVIDHIQRKTLILKEIKTIVFDEADEMLAMGFIDDMETILKEIPKKRQVLLFSATLPKPIRTLALKFMDNPESVQVSASELVVAKIKQVFYEVREEDKIKALTRLLDVEDPSLTLIFCHTKREVDDVSSKLQKMGYHAGAIHGDFTQDHRDEMIRKFKKGDIDILVATDVAARGLDISDVSHVINFSIPQDPDSYVHRIGRTGRAGKSGIAITFVTPREYRQLRLIELSAKTKIKKGALPTTAEVKKAREDGIVADFTEAITQGKHTDYLRLAETLLSQHPAPVVAAAALSLIAGDQAVSEIKESSSSEGASTKGFVKLFMTIGRKDKIQVVDIVKSISAEAGIPARRIGNIALYDTFSFVEVPADLADRVVSAINDVVMKGRKVRIQHAKKCSGGKRSGCTRMEIEKRLTPYRVRRFRSVIYSHYLQGRRKLPWRRTTDPYRILVSEIMLQQTRVDRVTEKYKQFITLFPDVKSLAAAPLSAVLQVWQGLGYNRRAIALHNAAKRVVAEQGGRIPDTAEVLTRLPGVGRYTAAAVMAFAYNQPVVFIETNIRTVFIHFFFNEQDRVADNEILPLVSRTLDRKEPRDWYNALMDYGTLLKKEHGNPNKKSAHYQKQGPFSGSDRQLRGQILRAVLNAGGMTEQKLLKQLNREQSRAVALLNKLIEEGFLTRKKQRISPA